MTDFLKKSPDDYFNLSYYCPDELQLSIIILKAIENCWNKLVRFKLCFEVYGLDISWRPRQDKRFLFLFIMGGILFQLQ